MGDGGRLGLILSFFTLSDNTVSPMTNGCHNQRLLSSLGETAKKLPKQGRPLLSLLSDLLTSLPRFCERGPGKDGKY